jgi:hypothetical protein
MSEPLAAMVVLEPLLLVPGDWPQELANCSAAFIITPAEVHRLELLMAREA